MILYRNQTVVANAATKLVFSSAVVVEKVCPTDVVEKLGAAPRAKWVHSAYLFRA